MILAGAAAGFGSAAWGRAPDRSPVPPPRPATEGAAGLRPAPRALPKAPPAPADLIAAAGLGGKVGFVVADARTGLVLEALQGGEPMPPASTLKAITSLYALEHLGAGYRFSTRLIATGPVGGGKIAGDLILAGGGDPTLTTDGLGDLAADLARAGVTGVTGRFLVWGGALPYLREIDMGQPDHLGYNPAVSGLNLNFNRVNFVWKRNGNGHEVSMDARARRFAPPVYSARVRVVDRDLPVYGYSDAGPVEDWTVARRALGKGGSRWLPVRRPDRYAGDVFQTLARAAGVTLPAPQIAATLPGGTVLATVASEDLRPLLTDMLRFSTNLTAEVVGMAASARIGVTDHVTSAAAMTRWLHDRLGVGSARFVDHSGLGGASRISPAEMVRALVKLGPGAGLEGLMRDITLKDEKGLAMGPGPVRIRAKTGTLNFVSSLTGYMTAGDGSELAFAIFTGDVARRDAVPAEQQERPPGGVDWVRRSKALQQQLIARWATVYGA
jgi:D-alanyl-D-alanine carboxypeptidase/D-alanyl-D-alanine-endopeptidase (penicillin-binding protein 4)